jgi:hypothetical protein
MPEGPAPPDGSSVGRSWLVAVTIVALVVVAMPIIFILGDANDSEGATRDAALAKVRAATAKYRDIEVARRDGYHRTTDCFESVDGDGGMGVHYQKDSLNDDDEIDLLEPEQLLYEPGKNGDPPRLVGVEYYAEFTGQRPPQIGFGPLDGPMPGHFPGQPKHYDIHVYVHRENPEGTFNIWNPDVEC